MAKLGPVFFQGRVFQSISSAWKSLWRTLLKPGKLPENSAHSYLIMLSQVSFQSYPSGLWMCSSVLFFLVIQAFGLLSPLYCGRENTAAHSGGRGLWQFSLCSCGQAFVPPFTVWRLLHRCILLWWQQKLVRQGILLTDFPPSTVVIRGAEMEQEKTNVKQ